MSELALTLLRLGFLVLLWVGVLTTLSALRRDLKAPREARPSAVPIAPSVATPSRSGRRAKAKKGSQLLVVEGPLKGTAIPLGSAAITLGRAQNSTLVLDDDYASTNHARIYPAGSDWVVEDLHSTNGTWLDKTRITRATVLPVDVPLRIGQTIMQLRK